MKWQPISTAPFDREVMICGPSGYSTCRGWYVTNAIRFYDYHSGGWLDMTGDNVTDMYPEPTHWAPICNLPEGECDA